MRIQVNLGDDLVERLDTYAKKMGVPRATLCTVLIGQGVMGFDKALEMVETSAPGVINAQ